MEVTCLPVAGHIDEIVLIYIDAMFARRPDAAILLAALGLQETRIPRPAPSLQHISILVELQHRWRRCATTGEPSVRSRETHGANRLAFCILARDALHSAVGGGDERTRAMIHPNVIVPVDVHSTDVADDPVVRQRLGPGGIEYEARRRSGMRRRLRCGKPLHHVRLLQGLGGRCRVLRIQASDAPPAHQYRRSDKTNPNISCNHLNLLPFRQ